MRVRLVTVFLALSTSVFALDLSGGLALSGGCLVNILSTSNSSLAVSSDITNTFVPFHAEVFVDGGYFRLGGGFRIGARGHQVQTLTTSGTTSTIVDQDLGLKGYLTFSLYAKYPFSAGPFVLFPLLGLEFDENVLYLDANGNDVRGTLTGNQRDNENQTWIRAGMGADWRFFESGYLRAELALGYKVPSTSENNAVANATSAGFNATLYTLQPDLTVAVGFRM